MNIGLTEILVIVAVLAFSISVHELMHSVVAYWLGDTTAHDGGRISLNPLQHIDPITTIGLPLLLIAFGVPPFAAAKPVPIDMSRLKFGEFGMALTAIAGPLSNLLLAVLFSFVLASSGVTTGLVSYILVYGVSVNIGLGLFNLIPFPPLDGSRVLYAIAPDGLRGVMMSIERLGFSAIIFFMFVIFPFISSYLQTANTWVFNLFVS